jgi:hypothetical protein
MTLGTQHRLKEAADLRKQHLRERHREQLVLVEEFIVEIWVMRSGLRLHDFFRGLMRPP